MPKYPATMVHPALPGRAITAGTYTSERAHGRSGWQTVDADLLDGMTRAQLDEVATAVGVPNPDTLASKDDVTAAVLAKVS